MDETTAKGLDPKYVAKIVRKCVVNKKEEYYITPFYIQMAICLRYMAPWLFFKIQAAKAKKEHDQRFNK